MDLCEILMRVFTVRPPCSNLIYAIPGRGFEILAALFGWLS